LTFINAHMQVKYPNPRNSKFSKWYRDKGLVDWDLSSPVGNSKEWESGFPCRNTMPGPATAEYSPGDIITFTFENQTYHHGGHCQFSLSYDDKVFGVLNTVLNDCFIHRLNFEVMLPKNIPSAERATLAWTWVNAYGNREFYMNCIDIKVLGENFNSTFVAPKLTVANLPGYPVIPEFY
ncbi:putative endoglucanase precursor, partial [Neoconidiobolus thromboides FSU 785]